MRNIFPRSLTLFTATTHTSYVDDFNLCNHYRGHWPRLMVVIVLFALNPTLRWRHPSSPTALNSIRQTTNIILCLDIKIVVHVEWNNMNDSIIKYLLQTIVFTELLTDIMSLICMQSSSVKKFEPNHSSSWACLVITDIPSSNLTEVDHCDTFRLLQSCK